MELGPLNTAALLSRRASSKSASTSKPVTRAYFNAYREDQQPSQAKAVALPWNGPASQGWETQEKAQYDAETARSGVGAKPDVQTTSKPLKINRDLLLYRAKAARTYAFRAATFTERLAAFQQSEAALRRCLDLDPVDPRTYVALGKLLKLQRRYDEARKTYEDGIAVTGGQNEYLWQAWASLEAKAGKITQARKYFKAAVLVNPEHAASWHAWGMLEKREGNLTAARDLWVKGVRKAKKQPNPHLYGSLAILAGEMGFVEEARAWFKQGTSIGKGATTTALWHAWAQLEERCGEPKIVRYLYNRGLEAQPRSRYVYLAWAMFEKLQGEVQNARRLLQRGQKLNPKDPAILQAWGILEAEDGNLEKARELLQHSTEADPQHVHAWHAWAMLELRSGNLQRARELFQSAVWCQTTPKDFCTVWQAWAVLEYTDGNYELARGMCSCAVKADPTSVKAWETWIYQEEEQGNESLVLLLRKAQDAGRGDVKLPAAMRLPTATGEEPDVIKSVMQTVEEWVQKFESRRRPVMERRPPSYLPPPTEASQPALLEQQSGEVPLMDQMIDFDSRRLALPDIPARRRQAHKAKLD